MTMWAAVIGSPIAHSLSPVIHRAAWEQLGIDGWEYRRAEVTEEPLPPFIGQLDESFCGLSVTMPCKQAVMPLLDCHRPAGERGRSRQHGRALGRNARGI